MIKILHSSETDFARSFAGRSVREEVRASVAVILEDVREYGDAALRQYTERFDGIIPEPLEVTPAMMDQAMQETGEDFLGILERAAQNIREYHCRQLRQGYKVEREDGTVLGQRILPIEKVGIYIPGGTAAYPSSVLMNAIPAKIAGCREIVMVSPPGRDGRIPPAVLAAAGIAGVDRIFQVGGAQAIAALAYGTESVPCVDKILGPGNVYVTEAKRQVFGLVAIDMIAGPSEILVISDGFSDPAWLAADLLSQAEHDKNASAILLTDSEALAAAVAAEIDRQLVQLPRREIASASIENNGKIILCSDIAEAVELANRIAPEHLELCVEDPFGWLDKVRNAGSVFLGRNCPEALGDYYGGTNHILPTGGTVRFSSALGVDDFVRKTQYLYYTPKGLEQAAEDVSRFAQKEGLTGHARSVLIRQDRKETI